MSASSHGGAAPLIITIDGPAGTGKSTVAHRLAEQLGIDSLDSGSMYRAASLVAIEQGIDPADATGLAEALERVELRFDWQSRPPTLHMDGRDISQRIREMDVSGIVSDVAKCPAVRTVLVEAQRQIGAEHPRLVSEGRDQGSIVFPDATVRFYLDADPRVRALRRVRQLSASGMEVDVAEVTEDIRRRDEIDSTRSDGPLICPEGAIIIDTSELEIDAVVERMVQAVEDRVQGSGC